MRDPNDAQPTDRDANQDASGNKTDTAMLKSNVAMLIFGFLTLIYLVAIDHEEWFQLRPISGVAVAMSQASDDARGDARLAVRH